MKILIKLVNLFLLIFIFNFVLLASEKENYEKERFKSFIIKHDQNLSWTSDGFDYPMKPLKKYYVQQKFGNYNPKHGGKHLGVDWSKRGHRNSDFGDPVYSSGNGIVYFVKKVDKAWGYVVRIFHIIKKQKRIDFVETFYAHLNNVSVKSGDLVKRGQKIGTIGNCDGVWVDTHLHMEMRTKIWPVAGGYSRKIPTGFINPLKFIRKNRPKNSKKK